MEKNIDMKELRRENKTGWLELADNEDVRFIIDAILGTPPDKWVTPESMSERSGVEEYKTKICLEYLSDLEVVTKDGSKDRYKVDSSDNKVLKELFHLNSAINSEHGDIKSLSERLED